MSVEAMAVVLHHARAEGRALVVLLGIANHAGDGGAWPTLATLARYGRCSERHAKRIVEQLARTGEVAVVRQGGGTRDLPDHRRPNRYEVTVSCPPECDGTTAHRPRSPGLSTSGDTDRALPGLSESDRVTPTSPGDTHVTRGGDTHVTQTVPTTTHADDESVPTSPRRARGADPEVVHRLAAAARAALRGEPVLTVAEVDADGHAVELVVGRPDDDEGDALARAYSIATHSARDVVDVDVEGERL